jgi:hypothetical protein
MDQTQFSNKRIFFASIFFSLIFYSALNLDFDFKNVSYKLITSVKNPNLVSKSNSLKTDPLLRFKEIHQDILEGKRPLRVSINGYTIGGYGNKLYSMLSSLVIALLTDSAFLVRWDHINLYIKEPFKGNLIFT